MKLFDASHLHPFLAFARYLLPVAPGLRLCRDPSLLCGSEMKPLFASQSLFRRKAVPKIGRESAVEEADEGDPSPSLGNVEFWRFRFPFHVLRRIRETGRGRP